MDNFEEEVQYFVDLVMNNINSAKEKKRGKIQTVFNCINVRLDGQEVVVYNLEKDICYNLYTKDIEKDMESLETEKYLPRFLALQYIEKLSKYNKKEISFEELAGIRKNKTPQIVIDLITQKKNISEQLTLLRRNRNIPEVQEYIDRLTNDEHTSEYILYLINRYYYNNKNVKKAKKSSLEKSFKVILRAD